MRGTEPNLTYTAYNAYRFYTRDIFYKKNNVRILYHQK